MVVIIFDSDKIESILDVTLISITKLFVGTTMKRIDEEELSGSTYCLLGATASGEISCHAEFSIENSLCEHLLSKMQCGTNSEEREEYLTEYVNIAFGRMVSNVSNYIGKSTRFTPPVVLRTEDNRRKFDYYKHVCRLFYTTAYGKMKFCIGYKVEAS